MSLYGERVGTFHLVAASADAATRGFSQIARLQLAEIYSPPAFGANIATMILSDSELYDQWRREIGMIHGRLVAMRAALVTELEMLGAPGDWGYVKSQVRRNLFTLVYASQLILWISIGWHVYMHESESQADSSSEDLSHLRHRIRPDINRGMYVSLSRSYSRQPTIHRS